MISKMNHNGMTSLPLLLQVYLGKLLHNSILLIVIKLTSYEVKFSIKEVAFIAFVFLDSHFLNISSTSFLPIAPRDQDCQHGANNNPDIMIYIPGWIRLVFDLIKKLQPTDVNAILLAKLKHTEQCPRCGRYLWGKLLARSPTPHIDRRTHNINVAMCAPSLTMTQTNVLTPHSYVHCNHRPIIFIIPTLSAICSIFTI